MYLRMEPSTERQGGSATQVVTLGTADDRFDMWS